MRRQESGMRSEIPFGSEPAVTGPKVSREKSQTEIERYGGSKRLPLLTMFTSSANFVVSESSTVIPTTSLEQQMDPSFLQSYVNVNRSSPVIGAAGLHHYSGVHVDGSVPLNQSIAEMPIEMTFNDGHIVAIVVYSVLFVLSSIGNITLLVTIVRLRMKSRLNRVNLFLLHLAIADLLVTFLLMPLEIGWAATVSWRAGDAACRIMSFFRVFGLYLSGFLLVCISLDRYFAVLKPLGLLEANRRGRTMLYLAWGGSFICSFPQALIFHVEKHPDFTWYEQCITYNFFPSKGYELAYSFFGFIFLYGFPLVMIISCYCCILCEICKINNLSRIGENLRRSSMGALNRAKIRTLKMTIVIVTTFFLCWTPYNVMSLWYWIDEVSAKKVDQRIQKGFFLFACTNSCVNPMVYGFFHIRRGTQDGTAAGKVKTNEKDSCKLRVRWKPRAECLCAASASSHVNSSSSGVAGRGCHRPIFQPYERKINVMIAGAGAIANHPRSLSVTRRPTANKNQTTRQLGTAANGSCSRHGPKKGKRVKFVNFHELDCEYNGKGIVLRNNNFYASQARLRDLVDGEEQRDQEDFNRESSCYFTCRCELDEASAQSLPIFRSCGSCGSESLTGLYADVQSDRALSISLSRSKSDLNVTQEKKEAFSSGLLLEGKL